MVTESLLFCAGRSFLGPARSVLAGTIFSIFLSPGVRPRLSAAYVRWTEEGWKYAPRHFTTAMEGKHRSPA